MASRGGQATGLPALPPCLLDEMRVMRVTCPHCGATLTVPDHRLPRGQAATAACPQCKGKLVLEPPPASPLDAGAPAGQPRALVCVAPPAEREQVVAALGREGYMTYIARDAADAVERLRFDADALVILHDGFGAPAGGGNPVLDHLALMGTARRRSLHVVFLSPHVRSQDPAAALARSVNLVLHVNDLPRISEALKRSRAEAEEAYRVLLESLRALGKG